MGGIRSGSRPVDRLRRQALPLVPDHVPRGKGFLAATCEWLILFIDMNKRRVAAMPDDLTALMSRVKQAHHALPLPPEVGRSISLSNKRRPALPTAP